MRADEQLARLWVTQEELYAISSALVEFYQETNRLLDKLPGTDSDAFIQEFKKKFGFGLAELLYVQYELWELEGNLRSLEVPEIFILLPKEQEKITIMYTALKQCLENFEDYDFETRTGISEDDLATVFKNFEDVCIANKISEFQYGLEYFYRLK